MESDATVIADDSDLLSVISDTTVGTIDSPVKFSKLSRYSASDTQVASPSIPDQNIAYEHQSDFTPKAKEYHLGKEDANSKSLLSEKVMSQEDVKQSTILDDSTNEERQNSIDENHSSQNTCKVQSQSSIDVGNGNPVSPLLTVENKTPSTNMAADIPNTEDKSRGNSGFLPKKIVLSPFTGFDSEIYSKSPIIEAPIHERLKIADIDKRHDHLNVNTSSDSTTVQQDEANGGKLFMDTSEKTEDTLCSTYNDEDTQETKLSENIDILDQSLILNTSSPTLRRRSPSPVLSVASDKSSEICQLGFNEESELIVPNKAIRKQYELSSVLKENTTSVPSIIDKALKSHQVGGMDQKNVVSETLDECIGDNGQSDKLSDINEKQDVLPPHEEGGIISLDTYISRTIIPSKSIEEVRSTRPIDDKGKQTSGYRKLDKIEETHSLYCSHEKIENNLLTKDISQDILNSSKKLVDSDADTVIGSVTLETDNTCSSMVREVPPSPPTSIKSQSLLSPRRKVQASNFTEGSGKPKSSIEENVDFPRHNSDISKSTSLILGKSSEGITVTHIVENRSSKSPDNRDLPIIIEPVEANSMGISAMEGIENNSTLDSQAISSRESHLSPYKDAKTSKSVPEAYDSSDLNVITAPEFTTTQSLQNAVLDSENNAEGTLGMIIPSNKTSSVSPIALDSKNLYNANKVLYPENKIPTLVKTSTKGKQWTAPMKVVPVSKDSKPAADEDKCSTQIICQDASSSPLNISTRKVDVNFKNLQTREPSKECDFDEPNTINNQTVVTSCLEQSKDESFGNKTIRGEAGDNQVQKDTPSTRFQDPSKHHTHTMSEMSVVQSKSAEVICLSEPFDTIDVNSKENLIKSVSDRIVHLDENQSNNSASLKFHVDNDANLQVILGGKELLQSQESKLKLPIEEDNLKDNSSSKVVCSQQKCEKPSNSTVLSGFRGNNTPEEQSVRRSSRESKQPVRFSSPEQPNQLKSTPKLQKITVNSELDDFEIHQEKLNSFIDIESEYNMLEQKLVANPADKDNLKRCTSQFKILQPQLMKLLSASKQESIRLGSLAKSSVKSSSKSTLKTKLKLLTIRQKKLKALFDKHKDVQSRLRVLSLNINDLGSQQLDQKGNLDPVQLSQSTSSSRSSRNIKRSFVSSSHPVANIIQSTVKKNIEENKRPILNAETGLFDDQCADVLEHSISEDLRLSSEPNETLSHMQRQSIGIAQIMENSFTQKNDDSAKSLSSGKQPEVFKCYPVGMISDKVNQTVKDPFETIKQQNEVKRNSCKTDSQKFVPPRVIVVKRIIGKSMNTNVAEESNRIIPVPTISHNKVAVINPPPRTEFTGTAPGHIVSTVPITHSLEKRTTSQDDEILDLILKSLDKEDSKNQSTTIPTVENHGSATKTAVNQLDYSRQVGREMTNAVELQTNTSQITATRSHLSEQSKQDMVQKLLETGDISVLRPQKKDNSQKHHLSPKVSSDRSCFDQLCSPQSKFSRLDMLEPTVPKPQVISKKTYISKGSSPWKSDRNTNTRHSPSQSVMSFTSGFSTSSRRFLMKMKDKALKINQEKTVREYNMAMGNTSDLRKVKKFPSLKKMIDKGLLKPGRNNLSIHRQSKKFVGSLLDSGQILDSNKQVYSTATKWLSSIIGTQLTMKAKAYRTVCYENKPLMEFKKQYDKLIVQSNRQYDKTVKTPENSTDINAPSSNHTSMLSGINQTSVPVVRSISMPTTLATVQPPYATGATKLLQSIAPSTVRPVVYQIPQRMPLSYSHFQRNIPGNVDNRFAIPAQPNVTTQFLKFNTNQNNATGGPIIQGTIGRQAEPHPTPQNQRLQQPSHITNTISRSETAPVAQTEIQSILTSCVKVLLIKDSELVLYPDITEDFWTKPFKDINISKEFWNDVDAW